MRKYGIIVLLCASTLLVQCSSNKNSVVTGPFDVVEPKTVSVKSNGVDNSTGDSSVSNDHIVEGGASSSSSENKYADYIGSLGTTKAPLDKVVVLGDSRVAGLVVNGYLSSDRVIYSNDADSVWAKENVESIKALNPKVVFVNIGLVDCLNVSRSKFKSNYKKLLTTLQSELPDATIVSLTLPNVSTNAISSTAKYKNIESFNNIIISLAKSKKTGPVELHKILGVDSLSSDGVSFHSSGYAIYSDLIKTIIK